MLYVSGCAVCSEYWCCVFSLQHHIFKEAEQSGAAEYELLFALDTESSDPLP